MSMTCRSRAKRPTIRRARVIRRVTPAARIQAALELLDEIINAAKSSGSAADTLIKRYFGQRYTRPRLYRNPSLCPPAAWRTRCAGRPVQDRPELRNVFDGSPYGPASLASNEIGALPNGLPDWLQAKFAHEIDGTDIASLSGRAAFDIRVNLSAIGRDVLLDTIEGVEAGKLSPSAVARSKWA